MKKIKIRDIPDPTRLSLYARSAGRCEFYGCNKILYKSPVTQENVIIAQSAHIWSFSDDGPRGWPQPDMTAEEIHHIDNLILVCYDCHKKIDNKNGQHYPAELLKEYKKEHEERIYITSEIAPNRKSHVILYGANIGEQKSILEKTAAHKALVTYKRYPSQENPVELSMHWSNKDSADDFWTTESKNLSQEFQSNILPRIKANNPGHFSVFALAPIPLLVQLGCLFTDKILVDVYQPHREPNTWLWQKTPDRFSYITNQPLNFENKPALIISFSGKIDHSRVTNILGEHVSIWELTVPNEHIHNDMLRSEQQLSEYRKVLRKLIVLIQEKHGNNTPLHIFPAMPVACAVEMGRIRMPKADMPWVLYDQNSVKGRFVHALTIKEYIDAQSSTI